MLQKPKKEQRKNGNRNKKGVGSEKGLGVEERKREGIKK